MIEAILNIFFCAFFCLSVFFTIMFSALLIAEDWK